jgi:hypothetical protein
VLPLPRPDGQPFAPNLVDVIVDLRRRNLSEVDADGVDLNTQYNFSIGNGTVFLGLNGTYILNQETRVTDSSPDIETVDTIYNPPDWRARALIGWEWQGFSTNLFVNHTDAYIDNRQLTVRPEVDAWTTVDVRFAYDFSASYGSGLLSGFSVALSGQNVLDEDPPSTLIVGGAQSFDTGYDAANANPLGRFISLEFIKPW